MELTIFILTLPPIVWSFSLIFAKKPIFQYCRGYKFFVCFHRHSDCKFVRSLMSKNFEELAFQAASVLSASSLDFRIKNLKLIKSLQKPVSKETSQQYQRHLHGIIRALTSDCDQKSPKKFKIPPLSSLSEKKWTQLGGPLMVRLLTRSYGLNGTVIPYETECSSYVDINFSLKKRAKIGNLIIPCDEFWNPQVEISNSHPKKYYSIFMIDADFPVESERERRQLCHWASLNHSILVPGKLNISPEATDSFSYIPPLPFRGTDTHRIIVVALEHDCTISIEQAIETYSKKTIKDSLEVNFQDRIMDIRKIIEQLPEVKIKGYQFFRTCWTKKISEFYLKLGGEASEEPIFGEYLIQSGPLPSPYLHS